MDEQLYHRILAALEVSHSPSTSPNDRALAYIELEGFKQRNDCGDYAMYILGNFEHSDYARHFAVQCLSHMSTTVGADPGEAGETLRSRAATLLTGGTRPLNVEAPHMKEAIASLVSDLAERSFPQLWPGFIEGVFSSWQNSNDGTAAEICMFVLRNIAEDCTDANFNSRLTTSRRNDILRAIKPHVSTLLGMTYSFMSVQYQTLISEVTDGADSSQETESQRTAGMLLRACLNMLRRYVLWVRPDQLLTSEHDFTAVCLTIMSLPSCREEASLLLGTIISRKLNMETVKQLMEQLPTAIGSTPAPAHETDAIQFWRTIGHMVSHLISVNAQNIAEDEALLTSPCFSQYIDLALGLLSHPSLRLAADLHLVFFNVFRMKKARLIMDPNNGLGMLAQRVQPIIALYWPKLIRPVGLDEGVLSPIYDEEFGDDEELISFFGQFRGQVSGVVRVIVDVAPEEVMQATRDALEGLLRKHAVMCTDNLDERGRATNKSSSVLELEAFGTVLENVFGQISLSKLEGDARCAACAVDTVRLLVTWRSKDPLIRAVQFNLLTSLRTALIMGSHQAHMPGGRGDADDLLLMTMDLCFCGLEGGESWEVEPVAKETPAGDAVNLLRRRAGACLIVISKAMPSVLVRHLEKLAGRVSEMVSRGGIREMQRMHCLEMLVAISNAVEDPQKRIELVGQIAGDSVREWTSEEITTMVASPMGLLTNCLGIDIAPFTENADPRYISAIIHRVHGISNALNTLQSISRRVVASSSNGLTKSRSSPNLMGLDGSSSSSSNQLPAFSLDNNGGLKSHGSSNALNSMSTFLPTSSSKHPTPSPFAALWPVILPNALSLIRSLHGIWAPECTQHLFSFGSNGIASRVTSANTGLGYLLTMSDQEMGYKTNLSGITQPKLPGADGASSTLYEAGGDTLGSTTLEEMRKRWMNELRTVVYVLIGTACSHGTIYELPGAADAVISAFLSDIDHMEHRHLSLLLKHAIEPFVLNCPSHQLSTILPPLLAPLMSHMLKRLSNSWQFVDMDDARSVTTLNGNHLPPDDELPAAFRRNGGLLFDDGVESEKRELILDKNRQELSRTYLGVLMVWLALTGDLAKAFINYDNVGTGGSAELDPSHPQATLGLNRSIAEVEEDAVKRLNANELARFLFLGNKEVSFPLAATITAAMLWADGGCCRRTLALAHRMVSIAGNEPVYEQLIGSHLFHAAMFVLAKSPPWLSGFEWDMLNLSRDIYCMHAIGIPSEKLIFAVASTRGQQNQPGSGSSGGGSFDQSSSFKGLSDIPSKYFNQVSGFPRNVLLESGGVSMNDIAELENMLGQANDAKSQKEAMREILRLRQDNTSAASSLGIGNAVIRNGVTGNNEFPSSNSITCRPPAIVDLPRYYNHTQRSGVAASSVASSSDADEALSGLSFLFGSVE